MQKEPRAQMKKSGYEGSDLSAEMTSERVRAARGGVPPVDKRGEGDRVGRVSAGSRILLVALSLLLLVLPAGCGTSETFDQQLNAIVGSHRFSILRWELGHILERSHPPGNAGSSDSAEYLQLVTEYFALTQQIQSVESEINAVASGGKQGDLQALQQELATLEGRKSGLRSNVEWILGQQVRAAFEQEGIFNPLDRQITLPVPFPPLNFRLARPPSVLIISPRERIESIREVMLLPDVDVETAEALEQQTDRLGVSSLVVELGGFGATYPTFVADDASLRWTLATVAEEWLHQYLAFTPLGFVYLLDSTGIRRDYEVATMNETVAGIVTDEIADLAYRAHYAPSATASQPPAAPSSEPGTPGRFDFNAEMRQIRLTVDDLLSKGQVDEAEQFMEERRQYLASQGYYIRKLNQAYFAFYGTYADEPTSVSPIGVELKELRSRSVSLRDFLNQAARMTSRQDLQASVQ
jgi:hypothetical protein